MQSLSKNYYIAETAFHHEGDIGFLNTLVDDLCELNINAIKFHLLFDLDDYITSEHPALEVLKKITIKKEDWHSVFTRVSAFGKDIVALANDRLSLKYLKSIQDEFPIIAVEIHSTGLNDVFLLEEAIALKKTIILGVGGSTFDEIQFAVDFLFKNGKKDILLMHGFQNYPTKYEDINFDRIRLLKEAFGLPVGYADHTDPFDPLNAVISVFPLSYGVRVFEKHVTNVFGEKRIDYQSAISCNDMQRIIDLGNNLYKTIGRGRMSLSLAELEYGNTGPMKKALVARRPIEKGQEITIEDIAYKRTVGSSMLQQKDVFKIIGAKAIDNIMIDDLLTFEKLEYKFDVPNFNQFFINKD